MAASSDLERNPWGVGGLGGDQTVVSGVVRLGSLDTVLSLAEVSTHAPSMLHVGPDPQGPGSTIHRRSRPARMMSACLLLYLSHCVESSLLVG
jgi:hypothetical protein